MSIRMFSTAFVAAALITTGVAASSTTKPKVSMHSARAKALSYVPHGTVKSSELETQKGVPVYSFEITSPKHSGIEEIEISGLTGKMMSRHHETSAQEKREPAEKAEH